MSDGTWGAREMTVTGGRAGRLLLGILLLVPLLAGPVGSAPAQAGERRGASVVAETRGKPGRLTVKVKTPAGVAANIQVLGRRSALVAKRPAGRTKTVSLTLPAGRYRLKADDVLSGGVKFTGTVSAPKVVVRPGRSTTVRVHMRKVRTEAAIRVVDAQVDAVSLAWLVPKRAATRVVRVPGARPPARVSSGALVASGGRTVTDHVTSASSTYSYGLFVRAGKRWPRAASLTVSTPASAGGDSTAMVLDPNTVVLTGSQGARLVTARTGMERRSARAAGTCGSDPFVMPWLEKREAVIGGGVLVQRSPAYPNGLVGRVSSICPGGGAVGLTDGSVPELVDYLDVKKPLEAGLSIPGTDSDKGGSCGDSTATISLTNLRIGFKPGGYWNYRMTSDVLGVPTSADIDFRVAPKLTITADISASGAVKCSISPPALEPINFPLGAIPMTWINEPEISLEASAKGTLKDASFSLTLGAWAKGRVGAGASGLKQGFVFEPVTTFSSKSAGEYAIKLGATLDSTLGVGRAQKAVGAVAGVKASLTLIEAALKATDDQDGHVCVDLTAQSSATLGLTASVWAGPLKISGDWALPPLTGQWAKADFPTGCSTGLPDGPTITTDSLPDATVGEPYEARLRTADNRPGPWQVTGLPAGLSLDGDTVTGTPQTAGDHDLTVRFTDAVGRTTTRTLALRVAEQTGLPWVYQFVPYDAVLPHRSGQPGTWSVSNLPAGLTLASREGRVSGTVTGMIPQQTWLEVGFTPDGGGPTTVQQVLLRASRIPEGLVSVCALESPTSGRFALLYRSDTSDAPVLPGKFVVNGVESVWGSKPGTTLDGWVRKKVVVMHPGQTYDAAMWIDGRKIAEYTDISTAMPLGNGQCGGYTDLLATAFPVDEEILGD